MTFAQTLVDNGHVGLSTRDYGGPGPALVLMHGAGMEQGSLEALAQELRQVFRVITFDFRGHGQTSRAPWTLSSAISDLRAVVEGYGLAAPAVGGHSLGGMVAAAYGAQTPTCPAVVNIDGHGRGRVEQYVGLDPSEVRQQWARQQARIDRLTRGAGAVALRGLLIALRRRPTTSAETLREVLHEVDDIDLFTLYRQLGCPLLVFNATAVEQRRAMRLWAGKGLSLVAAYREGLARDFAALAAADSRVQVITVAATHMLIRTHPSAVARHIEAFLEAAGAAHTEKST